MIKFALKGGDASAAPAEATVQDEHIAPVPRISIQAFCASADTAAAMQAASEDRRMTKAHLKVQMGGIAAATEAYRASATPNVVIIESDGRGEELLGGLDMLAEVCDAGTRVIAIGHLNDIVLYREMVRRGVSDYLIAPVGPVDLIRAVSGLFYAADAKPVGRTLAVVGAKGGVGASTVAHNIAWAIARDVHLDAVVADLDLPFGTAGLDFNQDPPQGIADAVMSPDRIDTAFVDRLLSKCTDHLSLLAAPATLDRVYDFGTEAFDSIFDVLRATVPCIVLDVPHVWTGWARRTLIGADDILIVAAPDLANLRNTKNLIDLLRAARPNDNRPQYCLNQVGVPKRPEIKAADFAKALEFEPIASIPFEPQLFGTAANNGQMIAEVSAGHRAAETFRSLAQTLTGRAEVKRSRVEPAHPAHREAQAQAVLRRGDTACSESVPHRAQTCAARLRRRPPAPEPARTPRRRRRRQRCRACAAAVRRARRADHVAAARARPRAEAARSDRARLAPLGNLLRGQGRDLLGADRGDRPVAARAARRRSPRARKSATSSTRSSRSRAS